MRGTGSLTCAELRREYQAKLEEASQPQLDAARAAFRTCSEGAAKHHVTDEHSDARNAWLAAPPTKP